MSRRPELCHEGHDEWRLGADGRRRCMVCERERNVRYRAKHRERMLERRRELHALRKAEQREQARLAEYEKIMQDVQQMRERVAKRKRQQELRRLLIAS